MSTISTKTIAIATVIGGALLGATLASAALVLPTQNCSYSFGRNFTMGSTGTDVMNLQKVLNAYPQTRISESGAGSPGMESNYYGAKTKTAIIKFQELHAADILTPNGLKKGNGNVYASTRAMLNQICTGVASTPVATNPSTTTTAPVTTGPVSVTLGANQPQQMIVIGQSGARLADFAFTGNGTVTNLQLQRVGISTDYTLTNVYLYDGNTRITDAASVVTGGYINFNSPSGLFSVNGSRTISVRADVASNANAGNSIGVKVNSVTTTGGTAATFTNVQGNQLVIAGVQTSAVNFSTLSNNGTTVGVDAGTTNYNVWSGSATVSIRAVNLKAATFKFVGSAPTDALANISLFVDGAKVGNSSTINAMNNNKITFDLGNTPFVLTTGAHTFDLRADIVKGSYRTITMSIENVSDLMLEDSNLAGVNVSATIGNNGVFTQSGATYQSFLVNRGALTANVDPAFVANKVTGGATSVPVGQFTLRAYGEDVKINTLPVNFSMSGLTTSAGAVSPATLNNVSLYVNGGQVGTNQNYTGITGLTYTLGSSLIIPANTTVTLTVKADMVSTTSSAYTAGTVAAQIGGTGISAQGQSSYEILSVLGTAITGNTLTVSSGAGTFAKTSGFTNTTVSPNTANVKIGSFTIQANSAESIKVNSIGVLPTVATYAITNVSNLTVKTGSTILGTPVGNPSAATTTFSFTDVIIPANGTQTFDVYADIGGAATGSTTVAMSVSYRGAISNTTTVSSASGATISSAAATLAGATLVSSSPVAQYVVGGSTFGIATFKLATAVTGTQANIRELRFTTTGTDAITSITVGGVTSPVISAGTTTVSGLNINIDSNGTDIPVTVKFSGFQGSATGGSLLSSIASALVTLGYIEGTSGSGSVITNTTPVSSNTMSLVASKPTVLVSAGNTDTLVLGAENKVGEFTVTADANGKISVSTASLSVSVVGITAPEFTAYRIADGNTTITTGAWNAASSTPVFTFTPAYEIGAGQSKTFSVYANVAGTAQASITPYVTSRLTSAASFTWKDVLGGSTVETGTAIYNFPTSSFSTKR